MSSASLLRAIEKAKKPRWCPHDPHPKQAQMPDDPTRDDKWMRQICATCGFTRGAHRAHDDSCPVREFSTKWEWLPKKWKPSGKFKANDDGK